MEELLALLKDGRTRSVELLATELHTTTDDVLRRIDFLARIGKIRRVQNTRSGAGGCSSCGGCAESGKQGGAGSSCAHCLPKGGFAHMGEWWEVVGEA